MKRKRKGSAMIWGAFLLIVFSLLILSGFEYSRIFTTMNMIHDSTSEGILSQVTVNAENVFSGVRESSGTARSYDELSWSELVNTDELYAYLFQEFNLAADGARIKDGAHQFTLNKDMKVRAGYERRYLCLCTGLLTLGLYLPYAQLFFFSFSRDHSVSSQKCPVCDRNTTKIHGYCVQPAKDLAAFGKNTVLFYCKRRYRCPDCGKCFSEKMRFYQNTTA